MSPRLKTTIAPPPIIAPEDLPPSPGRTPSSNSAQLLSQLGNESDYVLQAIGLREFMDSQPPPGAAGLGMGGAVPDAKWPITCFDYIRGALRKGEVPEVQLLLRPAPEPQPPDQLNKNLEEYKAYNTPCNWMMLFDSLSSMALNSSICTVFVLCCAVVWCGMVTIVNDWRSPKWTRQ